MARKRIKGWIYKCSLKNPDYDRRASWVDPEYENWLHQDDDAPVNWGGESWIRSPLSWGYLEQAEKGDLVFCHQTDMRGLVGLTIAATAGCPDPNGDRCDICSTIFLGPDRIAFDVVVTVRMIREIMGSVEMEAYAKGTKQHTFHPVEGEMLFPLLKLCSQLNPRQRQAIRRISGLQRI
jgi:hypothetical protein